MQAFLAPSASVPAAPRSSTLWIGRVLSGLPVLFLAMDSSIKLVHIPAVTESMIRMGIPDRLSERVGLLQLACLVLYVVPRTAVLGAVLLTGYLGGAVSLHLRIADPMASHTLFPVYVGALLWLGLYLRDPRLQRFLKGE